jgi:hypothetical protein
MHVVVMNNPSWHAQPEDKCNEKAQKRALDIAKDSDEEEGARKVQQAR